MAFEEEGIGRQACWKGLVQVHDGRHLFAPLSNSVKIKYTCIAVSANHVVLGANTGGVYCFTADKFQCLLANREGSVSLMSFSPTDNRLLAVVAGGNSVCFWEHNLEDSGSEAKRFHVSSILRDSLITDMVWDRRGTRLFYGDNQGRIAIAFVPRFSRKFGSSSLFKKVDGIIHSEKAAIVQLDMWQDTLLVSTMERCCILRLQGEVVEALTAIGTKATRIGAFGACFYPRSEGRPPIVYSARPKGRLWAADIVGTVISTVRPRIFVTTPPSSIIDLNSNSLPPTLPISSLPSFSFRCLSLLCGDYLVTWQESNLFFQVFHESSYSMDIWTADFSNITNVVSTDNKIYVLHDNCQKITCFSVLNMSDTLRAVVESGNHMLAQEILLRYTDVIKREVPLTLLPSVIDFVVDSGQPLVEQLQELIELVKSTVNEEATDDAVKANEEETDGGAIEYGKNEATLETAEAPRDSEEVQLFAMEGDESVPLPAATGKELVHVSEDEEDVTEDGKKVTSLPHSFPTTDTSTHNVIDNSLPDMTSHAHQNGVKSSPISSPPTTAVVSAPPLSARVAGGKLSQEDGDRLVVRSISREKKKKSSKMKKRRGSTDATKSFSQTTSLLALEDILESDNPLNAVISPSHSTLSSTATSADNSPHTSLPPSPPRLDTIDSTTDITSSAPVTAEDDVEPLKVSRSMSCDSSNLEGVTEQRPRSYSQIIEPDILRPTKLLSRVKSMASGQDGGIQRTGRFMKEFLSSISSTPVALTPSPELGVVRQTPELGEEDRESYGYRSPPSVVSPPPTVSPAPVDTETERFLAAVSIAMQVLNNPQVLCSTQSLRQALNKWVEELHIYHAHLLSLDLDTEDPFSHTQFLQHDLKDSVCELANLCLEMEIFSSTTKRPENVAKGSEDVSNNVTKESEGSEVVMGSEDAANESEDATKESENATKGSEGAIEVSEDAIKGSEDATKGFELFVRQYRSLLSVDKIRYHLSGQELATACVRWRLLASSEYTKSVEDAPQELVSSPPKLTPSLMSRLYQEDRQSLPSLCAQQYPAVRPWEMAALCQIHTESDESDTDTYCQYLDLLFAKNLPAPLKSCELILASVAAALVALPAERVRDEDTGEPLCHSHLVTWPHETSLTGLTGVTRSFCLPDTLQTIISMFRRKGYWKGYLELCVQKGMSHELWNVVSCLGNATLLHSLVNETKLFNTTGSWQAFTSLLVKKDLPVETESKEDLSWELVVKEMVGAIGVEEVGAVLDGLAVQWSLPRSLHEFLLKITAVHREQRTLAHNLLEKLDRYLWSVRPVSLGPHLLTAYQREDVEDNSQKETLKEITSPPPDSYPSIGPASMEDTPAHWGIRSNTCRCMACGHFVISKVSEKEQGVIGFQCGHLYHRHCLPEQACLVCFVENYRTFLTQKPVTNKR